MGCAQDTVTGLPSPGTSAFGISGPPQIEAWVVVVPRENTRSPGGPVDPSAPSAPSEPSAPRGPCSPRVPGAPGSPLGPKSFASAPNLLDPTDPFFRSLPINEPSLKFLPVTVIAAYDVPPSAMNSASVAAKFAYVSFENFARFFNPQVFRRATHQSSSPRLI